MEGYTQGHVKRKYEDVLLRVPKTSYFRIRYREMPISMAHSSEIVTENLYFKGKSLDNIGRKL